MARFNNVLFDLDGTLIDPGQGIAGSIQFVLDSVGASAAFDSELRWFVGPPLTEIFARLLRSESGSELIESAVSLYIERFSTHGAAQSTVYPGILNVLSELNIEKHLFLVTSKNTEVAVQILTALSVREYLDDIVGTERDDRFANKSDAVRFISKRWELNPESTAIVGDRQHDVTAGKNNGIFTIGVTYGYGSRHELIEAGADWICDTPSDLLAVLRE
jgi:phosphoglycolate phosphatase